MKSIPPFMGTLLLASAVSAANLFPQGDFSQANRNLSPLVFTNGGRVSLFEEQASWNKCVKLEIVNTTTNKDGAVTWMAAAVIGSDGKAQGLPVKGGTTYDFSVEVRGDVGGVGFGVMAWKDGVWKDAKHVRTTIPSAKLTKDWKVYKGSFTVPAGKVRAGLVLQLWDQRRPGEKGAYDIGSCLYFDNVKIEEAEAAFPTDGGDRRAAKVPVEKALADGVEFADFFRFERYQGATVKSAVPIRAQVRAGDDAVVVDATVEGHLPGESMEVHFGPTKECPAREYTQLIWDVGGGKTVIVSGQVAKQDFEIVRNEEKMGVWSTCVRIPYRVLGCTKRPASGERVRFNLSHSSPKRGWTCWSPVKSGFADVKNFGSFYFGTYAAALKAEFGVNEQIADRAAFEARVSDLRTAAKQAELDRFKAAGFSVTEIPIDTDFAMPFVPRQSFSPVKSVKVRAAVNERTGTGIAVLNTTDKVETYVVRLETDTADPGKPYAEKLYEGAWGLKGFPPEKIVAREAVPVKDSDTDPPTTRLDALPTMNDMCSIRVAPREAGLVWFDFDCNDVKPGEYRGRVRVIPISEASKTEQYGKGYGNMMYKSKMQDVPFTLEVLPIVLNKEPKRPMGFFQNSDEQARFDLMADIGCRDYSLSPWFFGWKKKSDGEYDYAQPEEGTVRLEALVRKTLERAKARGFRPTFFIGFSGYNAQGAGVGLNPEQAFAKWPKYIRGVKHMMNGWGVDDRDYVFEVFDEPALSRFDEVKKVLAKAHEVVPTMRLALTLGYGGYKAGHLRELDGLVDCWILWTPYFGDEEIAAYAADALKRGKAIWHYMCSESAREPIYTYYRLHPWIAFRHRMTGSQFFLFQNAGGGYGNTDFKTRASSGIAYSSFGKMIPTLRYMAMRRGMYDQRYLELLEEREASDPAVKAFLDGAWKLVLRDERHDWTAADRVRTDAIRLLTKPRE